MPDQTAMITCKEVTLVFKGAIANQIDALRQFEWSQDPQAAFFSKNLACGEWVIDGYDKGFYATYLDGNLDGLMPAISELYKDLEALELDVICSTLYVNAALKTERSLKDLVKKCGYSMPTRELPAIKATDDYETHIERKEANVFISGFGDLVCYGDVRKYLTALFEDFASVDLLSTHLANDLKAVA